MCSPTSCPNALDGSSNGVLLSWDPTDLYHCTWSHGHAYGEPLLTHTCARTHMCSSRYTHTAISPPACRHHARAPHCQINCSAALCTRISSSMHPVLPPPPASRLLQPYKCVQMCQRACKALHAPSPPPSSVDAPHEDNLVGSPLAPNPLPRGTEG